MEEKNYALGMIETIGFPGLVAALDGALKTADVYIKTVQGADAGIVTVYIVGDVASVKVAVEVGASLAERVGRLSAKHVIASPDKNVVKMLLDDQQGSKMTNKASDSDHEAEENKPEEENKRNTIKDYRMMTLVELKNLVENLKDFPLSKKEINKIRKDELIQYILEYETKEGGDS